MPRNRYIVPEGFVGCVEVELGMDGGMVFPRRDGFAEIEVTQARRFTTSEPEVPDSDNTIDEVWIRKADGTARRTDAEVLEWRVEPVGGPLTEVTCFGGAQPPAWRDEDRRLDE